MSRKFNYEEYIKLYGALPPLPTFNQWYKARWKALMGWELKWDD